MRRWSRWSLLAFVALASGVLWFCPLSLDGKPQSGSTPVSCCFHFPTLQTSGSLWKSWSVCGIRITLNHAKMQILGLQVYRNRISGGDAWGSCFYIVKKMYSKHMVPVLRAQSSLLCPLKSFTLHFPSPYFLLFKDLLSKTGLNNHI